MCELNCKDEKGTRQQNFNGRSFIACAMEKGILRIPLYLFISSFVCHNTIVRLWKPCEDNHGHEMILTETGKETCMEWQILNGECHKKYADCYVVGVTDIVCEHDNEAVNIVIDVDSVLDTR